MSIDTRRISAAIFNNDKLIEVVLALDSDGPQATAQQIARRLVINHDLVKKVLVRLEAAGLVKEMPRVGGRRGALPYEVQAGDEWRALLSLCRALQGSPSR